MKRTFLIIAFLCALSLPALAQGQVEITADTFTIAENNQTATFSGNVVVTQEGLTVWANQVVVNYGSGGPSDIQSLEASGDLRIKAAEQTVTGQKGIYDPETRIMRVTGNVTVTNSGGTVTSPEVLVNFATNTAEFTGNASGRVTSVFTP